MIDPYKVLGISPGASQEEIKKAYRKKAKECHPDLHSEDPEAASKMNEVNLAYEMLQNPKKYKAKQEEEQRRQQARTSYGNYGQGSLQDRGQGYGQSQGAGGWYSDFGGFDFEDIFGFGFGTRQYDTRPFPQAGDSDQLVRAINAINSGRFTDGISILSSMTSDYRNSRWFYVSSLAYQGIGDTEKALELIQKAAQMEPNNPIYKQLFREYSNKNQRASSSTEARGFYSPFGMVGRIIFGFMAVRFIFNLLQILLYGLLYAR